MSKVSSWMTMIEITVDSVESALAAQEGGAHRIELCSALGEGGLTPSLGLVKTVRACCSLPLFTIIRPRGGDFLYTDHEFRIMQEDIRIMGQEGVDGVVLGILTSDGLVDIERTRRLTDCARPMDVTFHRAIDMVVDIEKAFEDVIASGVKRILTSGAEATAWAGRERIRRLVNQGFGRATVLVGGGVRTSNIGDLIAFTGATDFHSSMRTVEPGPMKYRPTHLNLGGPAGNDFDRNLVLPYEVRDLVNAAQRATDAPDIPGHDNALPLTR